MKQALHLSIPTDKRRAVRRHGIETTPHSAHSQILEPRKESHHSGPHLGQETRGFSPVVSDNERFRCNAEDNLAQSVLVEVVVLGIRPGPQVHHHGGKKGPDRFGDGRLMGIRGHRNLNAGSLAQAPRKGTGRIDNHRSAVGAAPGLDALHFALAEHDLLHLFFEPKISAQIFRSTVKSVDRPKRRRGSVVR